jgi:hypothetical protein
LPIEICDAVGAQRIERTAAPAEGRRHAQARNRSEQIGSEQRGVPGNRRTPVVADNGGRARAERCNQRHHVADSVEDAVGRDILGRTALAEAAHVGGGDTKAGRRERLDLVTPGIGQFRPAMAEQNKRAVARLAQGKLDPVDGNHA